MYKLFFTYMVLCSDESFYVGVTNDVLRRVLEHNSDDSPDSYCHKRRPVQLVHVRTFFNPEEAISYEKQTQKWSRKKKWALALGDLAQVHKLAECRNETHYKNLDKSNKLSLKQSKSNSIEPILNSSTVVTKKKAKLSNEEKKVEHSDDEIRSSEAMKKKKSSAAMTTKQRSSEAMTKQKPSAAMTAKQRSSAAMTKKVERSDDEAKVERSRDLKTVMVSAAEPRAQTLH